MKFLLNLWHHRHADNSSFLLYIVLLSFILEIKKEKREYTYIFDYHEMSVYSAYCSNKKQAFLRM